MKEKRGASHVDWVISVGIFIIYVMLLLVWIKPGYKPVYEETVLVDTVKVNVEKDYSWEVNKTLLKLQCNMLGTYSFDLTDYISLSAGKFDLIAIKEGVEERAIYSDALTVNLFNVAGKNNYWVVSSDALYGSNSEGLGEVTPGIECTVSVGEPIVKKGLKYFPLPSLDSSDWGFPDSREFKIILTELSGSKNTVCYSKTGSVNCDSFQPDSNVAVNSFEWRYNILDKDHNYSPVMINILIW